MTMEKLTAILVIDRMCSVDGREGLQNVFRNFRLVMDVRDIAVLIKAEVT
jgi:hypothetical protein